MMIPIKTTQTIIRKCSPAFFYTFITPLKNILQFTKATQKTKVTYNNIKKKVDTPQNLCPSNNVGFPETTTCACDYHFLF
jgi:hypothetical protein